MISQAIIIQNKLGLHARASAKFVAEASKFPCYVGVKRGDVEVDGKSIMGIMMLAAAQGSEIILLADGEQAEQALATLVDLINQKFGEAA